MAASLLADHGASLVLVAADDRRVERAQGIHVAPHVPRGLQQRADPAHAPFVPRWLRAL